VKKRGTKINVEHSPDTFSHLFLMSGVLRPPLVVGAAGRMGAPGAQPRLQRLMGI
jgi:hypothetical protein